MSHAYTEDQLVEQPAIGLFAELGWQPNWHLVARDVMRYAVPFDFIVHPLFVRRDIESIFTFRQEALRSHLGRAVR
jgi:hypothetical protein